MKILYASPEASPFYRTGGIADVAGSLPSALRGQGADVRVILPLYGQVKAAWKPKLAHCLSTHVELGKKSVPISLYRVEHDGIVYHFIDNGYYFYSAASRDIADDGERFAFFCASVVRLIPIMGWRPDIIACSGWQAAAIPLYLSMQDSPLFRRIRTVFTIHDVESQGRFPLRLARRRFGFSEKLLDSGILELDGELNLMKSAICKCDMVTTVSPTYAAELRDSACAGSMARIIEENSFKLRGIINGIDVKCFDPEKDPRTYCAFSREDSSGKSINKRSLQLELGLDMDDDRPLIACVNHLAERKGMYLVAKAVGDIVAKGCQLAILGTGEPELEKFFDDAQNQFPGTVALVRGYSEEMAVKIYAGADILLMPSRYEPCGLQQMAAMRYGAVPVVRETGGLRDTVRPYPAENSNGFCFSYYNTADMMTALCSALALRRNDRREWALLAKRCMDTDFSWEHSAREYIKIFSSFI